MEKINVQALGLTLGLVWGAALLLLGLSAAMFGYGVLLIEFFSILYVGYAPTFLGALLGGVWGFVDAYIGGLVVAWLYNKLSS